MWKERTCLALGIAGGVAVLAVVPTSGAGASSRAGLTTIDVPGAVITRALGINKSGEIVGSYDDGCCLEPGFADIGGTFTTIEVPGAVSTLVFGVNDHGLIVGTYASSTGPGHGFTDQGGTITLFDVPGASSTDAFGVSDHGLIVGDYTNGSGTHGFVFSPAG